MDKRTFLKQLSVAGIGTMAGMVTMGTGSDALAALPDGGDEDLFWATVRKGYDLSPDFINLENGYYCIMPLAIQVRYFAHIKEVNREGAHYMRTVQAENKTKITTRLAALAGCSAEELIITRNTTESLDLIISGLHWQRGDEAIMAEQDYGAMLDMFTQVAQRYGTVNKRISIPHNPASDDEIVKLYADAITPRTKLIMVCHIINITGQVLPVRKICDMAHARGVKVMVDGAHALAHLQFSISDLNCDFYGASLHKWLSAPLGSGMLYIRKEHIPALWPLFAEEGKEKDDILRLNHTGTHPPPADLTISDAIDFYEKIGAARKEARLRFLRHYWTDKVQDLPGIIFNSPRSPERSCAIANVGIKGMPPATLAGTLMEKYHIYTVAIDKEATGVHGVRITPNIYTTTAELDQLVQALKELAA